MPRPHGFSRDERIKRTADFDRAFRQGTRARGKLVSVAHCPNGLDRARLGVALPRGWGKAAARNRAKRLIREAFRTHKDELPSGIDLVVVPNASWQEPRPDEIAAELVRLVRRSPEGNAPC
jgi:ribonuclease P protein component